jgi:cytochrome oxidase Cu insertion factor (SCO1/SenC/PrrC family)
MSKDKPSSPSQPVPLPVLEWKNNNLSLTGPVPEKGDTVRFFFFWDRTEKTDQYQYRHTNGTLFLPKSKTFLCRYIE